MRRFVPALSLLAAIAVGACHQDLPSELQTDVPMPLAAVGSEMSTAMQGPAFMPGEVLMRTQDGVDPAEVARGHGLSVAARGYADAFVILRGPVGNEQALAARLGEDRRVVWAEPNWLRHTTQIDPRLWAFYNPGGLSVDYTRGRNSGQAVTGYLSVDDADEDVVEGAAGNGGSFVLVGSIDTGVDFNHAEFNGVTLIAGSDWYSGDNDPSDTDGHGTHTTGTMVGNTVGVAGVAGANVGVYVQRVCGPQGCPISAISSAIREAADQPGMVAMNLSLGGSTLYQSEIDAITYATDRDVLVIASAGNGGTGTVGCPACDTRAISVAATNWQDDLSYYSNWGPGLDISAPGGELYSNTTDEAGIYSSVPGGYAYYQGTSMAAPQVTGAAGVVAAVTGKRGSDLRAALEGGADDLGANGYDQTYGNGRLNLARALGSGGGDPPPPPPPASLDAAFTFSCNRNDCQFDASSSTGASSYDWTFGDGGTGSGVNASHTYGSAGLYTVMLTVGDGSATDTASQQVTCEVKGPWLRCR